MQSTFIEVAPIKDRLIDKIRPSGDDCPQAVRQEAGKIALLWSI